MSRRDAKQGKHLIADELVDDSAVSLDDLYGLCLDARHDPGDFFGVESLVHRRVSGQVTEQHRGLAAVAFEKRGVRRSSRGRVDGLLRRERVGHGYPLGKIMAALVA